MKLILASVIGITFLFVVIVPLQAGLITPVTATASGDNTPSRIIAFAVDGSGLTGNLHTSMPDPNMWLSVADDPAPWYKINLGGSFFVDSLQVWNYNELYNDHNGDPGTNRGFQNADIWRSDTGIGTPTTNLGEWTLILDNQGFTQAPGTNGYAGETVNLGGVAASYILFDDITNFGTNDWGDVQNSYGLSEVQAFGSVFPEPTTLARATLGLASLGYCRRRSR